MTFRDFYTIIKPGIVYGNLFNAIGAFFLAAHWHIDLISLFGMVLGLAFIIASGSAFNNYIDRDIDGTMNRTKTRASVTGAITPHTLLSYASLLGLLGTVTLLTLTNLLTLAAALFGLFAYVVLYTLLAKRGSEWGTLIGSVSGAMPPVVGYVAAANQLDTTALMLFLMLVFWQMPHAYAIALYRFDDYKAANVPVLPVKIGVKRTKIEMLLYVFLFAITAPMLTVIGSAGMIYGITATIVSLLWIIQSIAGFYTKNEPRWARAMFIVSLLILVLLFLVMGINSSAQLL